MSVAATQTWRNLLADVLSGGAEVSPSSAGADFRGRTSQELLAHKTVWPMSAPVIACPGRRLGYKFMPAEAAWILSGDNRLSTIMPYAKSMARFTDDGRTLSGSYGPPFVEQVAYVVRCLADDGDSRQAVATIWRPRPGKGNDTPCTVALQWMIRADRLCCVATMRSSDAWTGVPYDIFNFSAMSAYVALALRCFAYDAVGPQAAERSAYAGAELRARVGRLALGELHLTTGSGHLYKLDWEAATACAERGDAIFDQAPINLWQFQNPDDLVAHLWSVARRDGTHLSKSWLHELTEVGS